MHICARCTYICMCMCARVLSVSVCARSRLCVRTLNSRATLKQQIVCGSGQWPGYQNLGVRGEAGGDVACNGPWPSDSPEDANSAARPTIGWPTYSTTLQSGGGAICFSKVFLLRAIVKTPREPTRRPVAHLGTPTRKRTKRRRKSKKKQ